MVSSAELKRVLARRVWGHHSVGFVAVSLGVHTALGALLFWRYAFTPGTVSDPGDPLLLMWIMEWVQRALLHSPSALFDAPMFHPLPDTLAYSDPLIPQALAALPLRGVGFGPVTAYNAVYLGGIVGAGFLTTLLFHELGTDRPAALVGSVVATYPSARLFHLAHMQMQVTLFWPLVLLLIHRTLRRPDARVTAALALALAAAPLASLYHGLFMALLLPPFSLASWLSGRTRSSRPLFHLAGAAAVAGLVLVPFAMIYTGSLTHLGQSRTHRAYSQLSDYLGISHFADIGRWLPSDWVLREATPQWVGGGAAWLLPIALAGIGVAALPRRGLVLARFGLPSWARDCLPYAVLGCLAMAFSLGPRVRWHGSELMSNPLSAITTLPAVSEIRNFQRMAFVVGIAGGALVALGLTRAARRRHRRLALFAGTLACITTILPSLSTALPAYRPPSREQLPAVYQWLSKQPEPLVLYELPLPRNGQPMEYLWAAALHHKRLVHGFSGYLPLTDLALRDETRGAHRPDFWRTLALLGATHLVVHTQRLSALEGGAATLAAVRDFAGASRIASFDDAEVYLVPAALPEAALPSELPARPSRLSAGGAAIDREGRCVTIGPNTNPLLIYAPAHAAIVGLSFRPHTPLGEIDEALSIERSADLSRFQTAPHRPLLSTSLAAYVRAPTSELWVRAFLTTHSGPFLRLSTRNRSSFRVCDLKVHSKVARAPAAQPLGVLGVSASHAQELAPYAIDGNPSTRWDSQRSQHGAEWFELDLGAEREIDAVLLDIDQVRDDYGRKLAFECSGSDPSPQLGRETDGRALLFERPRTTQVLPLAPARRCRTLRIRQTGSASDNHWSIAELQVLGRP